MQLSIKEAEAVSAVLLTDGTFTADGKAFLREGLTGEELSAHRWYNKLTQPATEAYHAYRYKKELELREKYKEELARDDEAIKKLQGVGKHLTQEENEKVIQSLVQYINSYSAENRIAKELNVDEELLKLYRDEQHEFDFQPATLAYIKKCYADYKFKSTDVIQADILDKLNPLNEV